MKKTFIATSALIAMAGLNMACAEDSMPHGNQHHAMSSMMDTRISLELSPEMKLHQLANMREHVDAIKSILGMIAENNFDSASKIAHQKLGLTPEMQAMCNMFDNERFNKLGLAFHKSGDELGDALQSKDVGASLRALNKTMQYCVECHATFRQ